MSVRVYRGSAGDVATDREVTERLRETAADGERALRVWTPPRQVAFGPRDANSDGYDQAREAARERGYAVVEREVGGRAVAHTGSTVAFALAEPVADERTGIEERYERATAALRETLRDLGVDAERGEPADSFCPGSHSLSAGGKVAGLAQRVRTDAAVVAGVVLVRDREALLDVLSPVYDALGVPFDPGSVGTVADAGGPDDPSTVAAAVERAFVGDRSVAAEPVRDT